MSRQVTMNKKELIELIERYPDDMLASVVLSYGNFEIKYSFEFSVDEEEEELAT
jgi:hypothetical protein